MTSSIQLNEASGSVGTNCCHVRLVSNPNDPLSRKLGTSADLAPAISSVPSACPRLSSQHMQINSTALSSSTNTFVSKTVSILGDNGPILSIDPQACPLKSSQVEQYHLSSQRVADVASSSAPESGPSLGLAKCYLGIMWSSVGETNSPGEAVRDAGVYRFNAPPVPDAVDFRCHNLHLLVLAWKWINLGVDRFGVFTQKLYSFLLNGGLLV
ncbi:hypothetical protein Nepgr_006598 [Nepenthes gracilis]|uniref:Uncharacterized protein n=1 Tax=Nepenthes gracilis TaxID=150966 RepID=A0AAD3S5C2_NEPGR|nr:hypothetical protein Nepgr_006598 [Nepenthes gracilis]